MSKTLDLVRANNGRRQELMDEVREIEATVVAEKRTYDADEQGAIDQRYAELKEIDERMSAQLDLESRGQSIDLAATGLGALLADRDEAEARAAAPDHRSFGERFVEARGESAFDKSERFVAGGLEMRAVLDTGSFLAQPERAPGVVAPLDQRTYLADLLPRTPTNANSLEYVQDSTDYSTNPAVAVAEGASKPEGGLTLTEVTDPIRTIAVWAQMTRQAAEDAAEVSSYLDGRLRYQLRRAVDRDLLAGNGTAPNIRGLLNRSGILTVAPAAIEDVAVTVRKAVTAVENAESVGEIIVLNPADAEAFDLTHYGSAGLNAVPNVAGASASTAWGLRQVRMPQIPVGTALVLDPTAVMVRDRMQPTAYWSDSHGGTFILNVLTLLLELRLGLQVFQPKGICKITFKTS